jgi:hypothetical protein
MRPLPPAREPESAGRRLPAEGAREDSQGGRAASPLVRLFTPVREDSMSSPAILLVRSPRAPRTNPRRPRPRGPPPAHHHKTAHKSDHSTRDSSRSPQYRQRNLSGLPALTGRRDVATGEASPRAQAVESVPYIASEGSTPSRARLSHIPPQTAEGSIRSRPRSAMAIRYFRRSSHMDRLPQTAAESR